MEQAVELQIAAVGLLPGQVDVNGLLELAGVVHLNHLPRSDDENDESGRAELPPRTTASVVQMPA